MNRTSIRALMLGAMLVALLATMASTAGASTWRSHGKSFTATAGSSTFDVGNTALACTPRRQRARSPARPVRPFPRRGRPSLGL